MFFTRESPNTNCRLNSGSREKMPRSHCVLNWSDGHLQKSSQPFSGLKWRTTDLFADVECAE